MNTFDKIDLILKQKKIRQIDLTNFLGVSKAIYSSWKSGRTDSYYKFIPQIAKFLNVSTDFLFFGEETHSNLTEDEKRLLAAYRDQSEEGKKMVRKLLDIEEPANRIIDDLKESTSADIGSESPIGETSEALLHKAFTGNGS